MCAEHAQLGNSAVELIEAAWAHAEGDVILDVPNEDVVCAGGVLLIGDHSIVWDGDIDGWIAACDRILVTGANTIVPGHRPMIDQESALEFRERPYFR
ncbi:hypothetical protein ACFQY4_26580 [Catellatospora bangladeshensis]|uniref:Uncharacterized protein n=1 Tax=Catellatospora bangladeshensis TaxID=310355 RepID=A0A8J3NN31_9ACTN|nr:hypothetical protein [Catellatospora bangladeshensis]GIF85871.1 hypothetical protein Cba03nite_72200 [Catellatospora bangladeshensis]